MTEPKRSPYVGTVLLVIGIVLVVWGGYIYKHAEVGNQSFVGIALIAVGILPFVIGLMLWQPRGTI